MSNAVITKRAHGTPARKLVATMCAAVVACAVGVLGAAPANASDARCGQDTVGINCGVIYNTSGVNVRIATNFSPTYGEYVGTISGVTATLPTYQNSNIFKDSQNRFYDWDAVYVGPRSCLSMKVGPGLGSTTTYNNTRTFGVWYKVNNFGANVQGLRSC